MYLLGNLYAIGQIGENAKKLCDNFVSKHNNIPWREIRAIRNRVVHDYDGLILQVVWDIVTKSLPELVREIDLILNGI